MAVRGQREETTTGFAVARGSIVLAFAAFLMIGAYDGATGVLLPSLQAYYGIGKGIISLLFLAMTLGYLSASFMSGALVARLGRTRFLAGGAAIFTAGVVSIAVHPPFVAALTAALIVGFGFGALDVGLNAEIASVPGSTTALNLLHACYGGGALIGPLIASGILAAAQPWYRVYALWATIGGALFVCFALLFRPAASLAPPDAPPDAPPERGLLSATLRLPIVRAGALFLLLYVGIEVTVGSWAYSFLTEVRHGNPLHSGWVTSGYWLGLTLGRLLTATISGRFASGNDTDFNNVRLIRYCLVGVLAGVLIVWLIPVGAATAFGLLLIGFSLGPIFPTTIALLPTLLPGRLVQSAIGFIAGTGSAGAALFPWLAGTVAQAVGLAALMPYLVVLAAAMAGGWLMLRRTGADPLPRPEA